MLTSGPTSESHLALTFDSKIAGRGYVFYLYLFRSTTTQPLPSAVISSISMWRRRRRRAMLSSISRDSLMLVVELVIRVIVSTPYLAAIIALISITILSTNFSDKRDIYHSVQNNALKRETGFHIFTSRIQRSLKHFSWPPTCSSSFRSTTRSRSSWPTIGPRSSISCSTLPRIRPEMNCPWMVGNHYLLGMTILNMFTQLRFDHTFNTS